MYPEIYIDYAIRLLECVKKKRRKNIFESSSNQLAKDKFFELFFSEFSKIGKKYFDDDDLRIMKKYLENNKDRIEQWEEDSLTVEKVKYGFRSMIEEIKNSLKSCNKEKCKEVYQKLLKFEKEKLDKLPRKYLNESNIPFLNIRYENFIFLLLAICIKIIALVIIKKIREKLSSIHNFGLNDFYKKIFKTEPPSIFRFVAGFISTLIRIGLFISFIAIFISFIFDLLNLGFKIFSLITNVGFYVSRI